MRRIAALIALAAIVVAGGCRRGDDDDERDTTPEPTVAQETPSVQSQGEFQLVGLVEHAFVGEGPDIDLDAVVAEPAQLGDEETVAAPGPGVMRVTLQDVSDTLRDTCGVDTEDEVEVFWTAAARFDPRVVGQNLEENIDGRQIGALGTIYVADDDEDVDLGGLASPEATAAATAGATTTPGVAASPAATEPAEPATNCVLVADQIGTSQGTVPTARPRAPAQPAATPVRTATPVPRTPTPTPSTPAPTESPDESPEESPEETP